MSHPFAALTPDLVLDAVESIGYLSDARILALNSYENRVYQVGIEDETPLIAKFYRPQRWTDAAIREEHSFTFELAECEVPVVAPLVRDGETLFEHAGFRFTLFPRRGGRAPEPGNLEQLYRLGQLLGRLHAVGSLRPFAHREALQVENFGHASLATLLEGNFIPRSLLPAYESVARDLLKRLDTLFADNPVQAIRLHGDCHPGNLLCRDDTFHMVDLDDCRMGPAVQDLWMMLAGERHERLSQLSELMDGYQEFHDFNPRELPLIEGLRSLRLMHYSAWLARPGVPPQFPLVRHRTLLGRTGIDAARAIGRAGRGAAQAVLSSSGKQEQPSRESCVHAQASPDVGAAGRLAPCPRCFLWARSIAAMGRSYEMPMQSGDRASRIASGQRL